MRAQSDDCQDPPAAGKAAGGIAGDFAIERVLPASANARGRSGADVRDRRVAPGIPVPRCAAVAHDPGARKTVGGGAPAHQHAHGEDGARPLSRPRSSSTETSALDLASDAPQAPTMCSTTLARWWSMAKSVSAGRSGTWAPARPA